MHAGGHDSSSSWLSSPSRLFRHVFSNKGKSTLRHAAFGVGARSMGGGGGVMDTDDPLLGVLANGSVFNGRGDSLRPKKLLLLISDTGGGHRASAQALQDAFHDLFPGKFTCEIVDIWTEYAAWPYNKFVPSYKILAKFVFSHARKPCIFFYCCSVSISALCLVLGSELPIRKFSSFTLTIFLLNF